MKPLNICNICQDSDKDSLSKVKGEGWVCDDCAADLEFLDKTVSKCQERKSKRLLNAKEH